MLITRLSFVPFAFLAVSVQQATPPAAPATAKDATPTPPAAPAPQPGKSPRP